MLVLLFFLHEVGIHAGADLLHVDLRSRDGMGAIVGESRKEECA